MKLSIHCFLLINISLFCAVNSVNKRKSRKHSPRTYLGLGFEIIGGIFGSTKWDNRMQGGYDWGERYTEQTNSMQITLRNCGVKPAKNYIVNGEEAVENEFPFIVALLYNGRMTCGAAILNQWWIITAAHCFIGRHNLLKRYSVITGAHKPTAGQKYSVTKLIVHQNFNLETMHSDIALIKVDRQIEISSKVNGICLPAKQQEESTGVLTVAGWGKLKFGENEKGSDQLQKVDLPIISDQQCSNMFSNQEITVYRSYLCTYAVGRDSCEGDSGGPAFQYRNGRAILIGIVSFGHECADAYPGVYTQVSWFLDWISDNIT